LQAKRWLIEHLHEHYDLYGEFSGVRSARKHIGWAVRSLPGGEDLRERMNTLESSKEQIDLLNDWFDRLAETHSRLPRARIACDGAANDDRMAIGA
jgi:tRNA-dihydrouridine synthase B